MSTGRSCRNLLMVSLFCCVWIGARPGLAEISGEPSCPALESLTAEGNAFYATVLEDRFHTADMNLNSMVEKWEIALLERVLCTEGMPYHSELRAAYQSLLATLRVEAHYASDLQAYENILVALMLTSQESSDRIVERMGLTGAYPAFSSTVAGSFEPFSWIGDYDGDGVANICEYEAVRAQESATRDLYAYHASDSSVTDSADCDPFAIPDFCADFNAIADNNILAITLPDDQVHLLELLRCEVADINGGIDADDELPIPNGVLDAAGELEMVRHVLLHPALDLSSGNLPGQIAPGVRYEEVFLAYNYNRKKIFEYVGADAVGVLRVLGLASLADGLLELLGGFMVLGDQQTKGAVMYLFGLVGDYALNPNPDPESFRCLPDLMSLYGDADGDGYCNVLEYNAFFDAADNTAFINAVFDPEVVPEGSDICPRPTITMEEVFHYNPANGHVYRNTEYASTWDGCQLYGWRHKIGDLELPGELATVRNAAENQWLLDAGLVADDRWFGFNDFAEEGVWEWASGEAVTYTNWNNGEPNDSGGDEEWAEIKNNGKWNDCGQRGQLGIIEFVGPCEAGFYPDFNGDGSADAFADNDLDGSPDGFPVDCDPTAVFSLTPITIDNSATASIAFNPASSLGLPPRQYFNGEKVEMSISYETTQDVFKAWNLGGAGNVPAEIHTIVVLSDTDVYAVFEAASEGEGEGEGEEGEPPMPHDGDYDYPYYEIDLSELLRFIQFFNSDGYHCAGNGDLSDEGFMPGPGDQSSRPPHSGDYAAPTWDIGLSELLRFIQFFNSDGYHHCNDPDSDEGFCPGPESLVQPRIYTLSTATSGNASQATLTVEPPHSEGLDDGQYYAGSDISLSLSFDLEQDSFLTWRINGVDFSSDNPIFFAIDEQKEIVAVFVESSEGEGGGTPEVHHGDYQTPFGEISLSELLRFIQFFNSEGYHCAGVGELSDEGYMPGLGNVDVCQRHIGDYDDPVWEIGLSELLRFIQFFNSGGYYRCADPLSDEGYCPGVPE